MARALLIIEADGGGIRRVFGEIAADAKKAAEAMSAEFRQGTAGVLDEIRQTRREVGQLFSQLGQEEKKLLEEQKRVFEQRKQLISDEVGYRTNALKQVEEEAKQAEESITQSQRRESQRRGRVIEDEAKTRERILRSARRTGEQWGARAWSTGRQVVSDTMGTASQERRRYASVEDAVNNAVYQAGGGRAEAVSATQSVQAFAIQHRMNSQQIGEALAAAQTEFSVLSPNGNETATQRGELFSQFLNNALLARNTGNDIGEFTRLAGLFTTSGIHGDAQRNLLLYAAGAAQRGSVETGSISREAMGSIRSRIGLATNAARREGRDPVAAAQRAFVSSMAELEVARSAGESPRAAGNAISSLSLALQGPAVQDRLRTNIRNDRGITQAQRDQLNAALFEADPTDPRHRRQRLRQRFQGETGAMELVAAFGAAGIDSAGFMNLTRGGGHGNPMSMLANQRRVLGQMLNTDTSGKSGIDRWRELANTQMTSLTNADVRRGEEVFGQSESAQIQQNIERQTQAMTDNTDAIVRATRAWEDFQSGDPLAGNAASAGVDIGGGLLAGFLGGRGGGIVARLFGGAGTGRFARFLSSGRGKLLAGGAATAALVAGGAYAMAHRGDQPVHATTPSITPIPAPASAPASRPAAAGPVPVTIDAASTAAIGRATAQEIARAGVPTRTTPHEAATQGARGASSSPTPRH